MGAVKSSDTIASILLVITNYKDTMEQTDQELWEEAMRTAELLRRTEPDSVDLLDLVEKAKEGKSISEEDLPIDYISDAQILTNLLLRLKDRGVEIA
jgi:hypothetical protein